ncbi:MAG: HNH endonuclease [Sulfurimonas sp.]|jgi:predicted HNH restriction endonuclease
MKKWLIVHSKESYNTNQNMIGFNDKKAQDIAPNDYVVYYIKGGYIKGLYKVLNKPWTRESSWNSNYQIEIESIKILKEAINIRPFILTLELFEKHNNDGHWGTVLQGSNNIKELSEHDFLVLKNIIDETSFEEKIYESTNNSFARKQRLETAKKMPEKVQTTIVNYKRNPDVVAEVLNRANGICEECKQKAPFLRTKDSSPYLEVHHMIQLSQCGKDTIENAIAVCPNCHRKLHYGQ